MSRHLVLALGVLAMSMGDAAAGETPKSAVFGKAADGTDVLVWTLSSKSGVTAKVMTLGATLVELQVPDKNGKAANVVFGFDDVAGYQSDRNGFFGCTTGRQEIILRSELSDSTEGRYGAVDNCVLVNSAPVHVRGPCDKGGTTTFKDGPLPLICRK